MTCGRLKLKVIMSNKTNSFEMDKMYETCEKHTLVNKKSIVSFSKANAYISLEWVMERIIFNLINLDCFQKT